MVVYINQLDRDFVFKKVIVICVIRLIMDIEYGILIGVMVDIVGGEVEEYLEGRGCLKKEESKI